MSWFGCRQGPVSVAFGNRPVMCRTQVITFRALEDGKVASCRCWNTQLTPEIYLIYTCNSATEFLSLCPSLPFPPPSIFLSVSLSLSLSLSKAGCFRPEFSFRALDSENGTGRLDGTAHSVEHLMGLWASQLLFGAFPRRFSDFYATN